MKLTRFLEALACTQQLPNSPGHDRLQEQLAKFMGTQESIIYAYDLATVPSVLPAFANSKDLLICDEVRSRAQQMMLGFREGFAACSAHHWCLSSACCRLCRMPQDSTWQKPLMLSNYVPPTCWMQAGGPLTSAAFQAIPSCLPWTHLQAVNWAIQNGGVLSRAKLLTFKHNDMDDLERVLREQARLDQKRRRVAALPCSLQEALSASTSQEVLVPALTMGS